MQIGLNSYIHYIVALVDITSRPHDQWHNAWVFRELVNSMREPMLLLDPDSNPNACHLPRPYKEKNHPHQEAWELR